MPVFYKNKNNFENKYINIFVIPIKQTRNIIKLNLQVKRYLKEDSQFMMILFSSLVFFFKNYYYNFNLTNKSSKTLNNKSIP